MKSLLVSGTDTDVGKTWVTSLLLRKLRNCGLIVGGYKPVCSGAELTAQDGQIWRDLEQIRDACGHQTALDLVCPQRFRAALAPPLAAKIEGRSVDEDLLIAGFQAWEALADYVLVEGAGGLLCPISQSMTIADLAQRLHLPLVIVAANRLGVISHTLLTIEVARNRGLTVAAVILNNVSPSGSVAPGSEVDLVDPAISNPLLLRQWCREIPIFQCDYLGTDLQPLNEEANILDWKSVFGNC